MPDPVQSLTIVCHLERIGPTYASKPAPAPAPAVPYVDFWMGLSAGYESSPLGANDALRLKSWLWSAWKSINFAGVPTGGGSPVSFSPDVISLTPAPPSPLPATFLKSLEDAFTRCAQQKVDVNFDPFQLDPSPTVTADQHAWNAFLGSASTWPGGLNQWMQLSLNFRIPSDELANYESIFAAPTVEPSTVFPVRRVPDPAGLSPAQNNWKWAYADDAADPNLKIAARINKCALAVTHGPDPIADLQTLQAKDPYVIPSISNDWTESLDSKVAELFDLPQLLLQVLAKNLEEPGPAPTVWPVDEGFHQLFVASLHDVVNSGVYKASDGTVTVLKEPSGGSLASEIAGVLKYAANDVPALLSALADLNPASYADWTKELDAVLSSFLPAGQATLTALPAGGISNTPDRPYLQSVDQLYARVMQPEALQALLLNRWTQVLAKMPSSLGAAAPAAITEYLKGVPLRKRMLLGLLGSFWAQFQFSDEDTFKTQVAASIKTYCLGRTAFAGSANLVPWPVVATTQPDMIATAVSGAATEQLEAFIVNPAFQGDSPAIEPEGLLIPLAGFQSQTAAGAYDLHQSLAGAGVLIRRVPPENADGLPAPALPWRVLNYARIVDANGVDILPAPVPVPLRLQYRNGISTAFAFYQNLPLATGDPVPVGSFSSTNPTDDFEAIFTLANAYPDPVHQLKLEGLLYGAEYQVAPYYIGHGGHLPTALTDPAVAPCLPTVLKLPAVDANVGPTATIPFQRKRAVSAVRLAQGVVPPTPATRLSTFNVPAIPPGVRTLAESVASSSHLTSVGNTLAADSVSLSPSERPEGAIILLTPPERAPVAPATTRQDWNTTLGKSFSFQVYPPSVDLPTWQRWVGFAPGTLDMRSALRSAWHRANSADEKKGLAKVDPDDPAVKAVKLVLKSLHGPHRANDQTTYDMTFPGVGAIPSPYPKGLLTPVQADPWTVNIHSAAAGSPVQITPGSAGSNSVDITVPEGEVWQFQFVPRVDASYKDHFDPALWPYVADTNLALPPKGEVKLRVEVASMWPGEADSAATLLYNTLKPTELSAGNKLTVALSPQAASNASDGAKLVELVQTATLYVQRWRWSGRPVYQQQGVMDPAVELICGFPFAEAGKPIDPGEPMDGILFGDRLPADRYELSRTIDYLQSFTGDNPPRTPDDPILEERNLTTLPGALYFRFGVRVTSRYAPLIKTYSELDTLLSQNSQSSERWRRTLVPCRFLGTLPKPSIRLIVPLTAALTPSDPSAPSTPPLTVLFNDRWYREDLAGLAEQLEGEILHVALPDAGAGTAPEFGFDPTLSTAENPYAGEIPLFPTPIGAVGSTFDTDTNAPLFLHTSFVQPPPVLIGDDGVAVPVDLAWHFIKVRYRRVLHPLAVIPGLSQASMASEWTEPVWVQLLPASNRWQLSEGGPYAAIETLVCDSTSYNIHTQPLDGDAAAPTNLVPSASPFFTLFLLIMRTSTDAFGRSGQESYVGFFPLNDFATQPALSGSNLNSRLVEVQHRADFTPNAVTIYGDLFPDAADRSDVRARIVRISPPIDVV